MTTNISGAIERTIRIGARPETVFRLLTDSQQMVRWQGLAAELDPRPGGEYRIRTNALGHTIAGRFLEVVEFSRVVYSWGWESGELPVPAGSTTVEITLTPDGPDTVLRLLHHGFPAEAGVIEAHDAGWTHYLARLATVAAGSDPGEDAWASGQMGEPA